MRAGKLRTQLTLQQPTEARGAAGGVSQAWADVATVYAQVAALTGRESFTAQVVRHAEADYQLRIRYRAGVSVQWRARHADGRIFRFHAVLPDERARELVILASEVPA